MCGSIAESIFLFSSFMKDCLGENETSAMDEQFVMYTDSGM